MAKIILADKSFSFDGKSLYSGAIGGAETAFISLCEAFSSMGHKVYVYNLCKKEIKYKGIKWLPLDKLDNNEECDLYIANRSYELLSLLPEAKKRVFWIHNPANYLLKWRYLKQLWCWKPAIVFSSDFHLKSYPWWAPSGLRVKIPYGISQEFLETKKIIKIPKPIAIFTSNPMRSLDWLLDLWEAKIHPVIPQAELHIFSSPKTYAATGSNKGALMDITLKKAKSLKNKGVFLKNVLPKSELAKVIRDSRVLLYRGDLGETYCLALGESQAVGIPAVIQSIGCVAERIIDKRTGFVAKDDEEFAKYAIDILTNDQLWKNLHKDTFKLQRNWNWKSAAKEFVKLFLN